MKNKILYIIVLASIALLGACNLNEYPVFDDNDAFVAFDENRLSAEETKGVLKIPVRLTSLNEINTTVTYELIDSTAISGRDYELSGGASVLDFDGSNAIQYIEIDILPHEGVFTGDLVFGVTLNNAGTVNLGGNDTIYVTILDLDHPLSAILGAYTGSGDDAWGGGVYSWDDVVFEKDDSDISKVWIRNVFSGYGTIKVYGLVNDDLTEISVPVNQSVGVISGYNGNFAGAEIPFALMQQGESLIFTISGNTVKIKGDYQAGIQALNPDTGESAGWFERVSDLTFVKK